MGRYRIKYRSHAKEALITTSDGVQRQEVPQATYNEAVS